jgi:hypothetical protein
MKRTVLGFVLTLATLGLATPPAMAEPGSPQAGLVLTAGDQEFIASLAALDPVSVVERPIVGKALCTALCDTEPSVSCPPGTTICTANNRNCAAGTRGAVTCNGVKIRCATPCPPPA